jgi:hypothetical protein
MTKGDQLAGFLRSQDASQPGGGENISLRDAIALNENERGPAQTNFSPRYGVPKRNGFGGHVHHRRFAARVHMGQSVHGGLFTVSITE